MGGAELVAFASDNDSTRQVAEVVAQELSAVSERVDVLGVQDVAAVAGPPIPARLDYLAARWASAAFAGGGYLTQSIPTIWPIFT